MKGFLEKLVPLFFYLSEGYESHIFVNYYVSAIPENFFHVIWTQIDCYSTLRSGSFRKKDNTLSFACYWAGLQNVTNGRFSYVNFYQGTFQVREFVSRVVGPNSLVWRIAMDLMYVSKHTYRIKKALGIPIRSAAIRQSKRYGRATCVTNPMTSNEP